MQFGLFFEWPNPTLRDWKTLFDEGVQQIQLSEELGFDYCLVAEHHFTNYGNSPSPLLQALYIGQKTERIKIGTAAVVLPVWQPLRLAEEIAVLDNLIDGRFMCGVGRGYQAYEMAAFGGDVSESRERFQETLDIILKAWTSEESFTYDGKHHKITAPVRVFPQPKQKPYPPLWLAGTSVDSMNLAADMGMMPMSSGMMGKEGMKQQLGVYAHALNNAGKPLDSIGLGTQCMTHVARTDEEAMKMVKYARWQNRAQRGLNRGAVVNGQVESTPYEGELGDEEYMERLFFGSPETVIRKFKAVAEGGATHISNWMMFGGMPHEDLMRSVRLMGEEVLPALKDVVPPAGLYEELLQYPVVTNEELQSARLSRAPRDMPT